MRVSVELVPRSKTDLEHQLDQVRDHLPSVNTINVPDIHRFEMRSWEACRIARKYVPHAIPHIRAIDVDPAAPLVMVDELRAAGVTEVIVISGDVPVDMSRTVYGTSTLTVIRKFREELPEIRVYGAFDPYRQGFQVELEYASQKLEAGASGLFTQPFFDLRLLEIYFELLSGVEVFWGFTSITSKRSMRYWRARNRAIFPAGFEPNLGWSRELAVEAVSLLQSLNGNVYFMPIGVDVADYLVGII
jgi:methylenetetrahydrofolate reductase (NADPH)